MCITVVSMVSIYWSMSHEHGFMLILPGLIDQIGVIQALYYIIAEALL